MFAYYLSYVENISTSSVPSLVAYFLSKPFSVEVTPKKNKGTYLVSIRD
jgi:hypothetical protein